jgi:lipopolysaccharide/colanic/teichoic acid biosynthesis glycosyltransferase
VLPSISLAASNLPRSYRIFKRAMDIVLSVVMLVLCLPLFLLVALLLKISSRGPVLYRQIRAGENGYPFPLYKFRSMVANAEALLPQVVDIDRLPEPVFKLKDDARVTPVGRILRRTSIDELPQIINVLKGEMSWVGPRPEDINIVRTYDAYFRERLKARPGITGLQQIRCRGVPSMKERMICDLDYIENRSLWLDVKILLQSIWVVLSMKGAW